MSIVLTILLAGVLAQAPAPDYRFEPLPKTAAELAARFTPEQVAILEMLNRRDAEHLLRPTPPVPGLIVPSAWPADPLVLSPFPATWPAAEALPKAIVVHQAMQAFAAYENGRLVRWGPVSTGRKQSQTPDGAYNLTWRSRKRRSTDNRDWLLEWYFNFINERGVSFHLFDLPGYPASHACVRLLLRDAQWLYDWGEQWKLDADRKLASPGTPVWVLDTYPFGSSPAWLVVTTPAIALPASVAAPQLRNSTTPNEGPTPRRPETPSSSSGLGSLGVPAWELTGPWALWNCELTRSRPPSEPDTDT